ncbi:MAG TPA: amidohydrolase family protein, partial [Steroidobacteraceae bacterium]|nr:amidohydrolase family protein [Steroidobacteraceae bacterium]
RTGIAETITIASDAGLAPEITHIKAQGHEQGRAGEIVRMMERATASGHYTPSDVYPYLAGKTGLADLLIPAWAQDGGSAALLGRFRQPGLRARIAAESEAIMNARLTGGAAGVYFPESRTRLVDLMHAEKAAAGEMVIRLIERAGAAVIPTVLQFGAEGDLETFIENDTTAIACDCGATTERPTHPRYSGAFPRVLARYVRERRLLTLEQALYKMTGLPASIVGIVDRGLLSVGMAADITVFDPGTIIDHATFEEPALASEGVREVLVNGRSEWHEGRATGGRGGTALFRARSMPTRPASFGVDRAARARSAIESRDAPGASPPAPRQRSGSWRLDLRVRQGRASSHAEGALRIEDGSRVVLEMLDFGELQTSGRWAALSGIARSEGTIGPVTIIIDASDPALEPARALVSVEGPSGHREWTLPAKAFILESARTGSSRR